MEHDPIMEGLARVLWCSAWADAAEECGESQRLSGVEITNVAPETPIEAWCWAYRVAGAIEQANGASLHVLLGRGAMAHLRAKGEDPASEDIRPWCEEHADRFGTCLAFMAMGSGVSWFDDFEEFPLEVSDRMTGCGTCACELAAVAADMEGWTPERNYDE